MEIATAMAFWGVSALFIITPGADWAYVIAAGIHGRVAPAVAGLVLGHVVATVVVAAGMGAFIATVPMLLSVLTVLGCLYLVYLGMSTLRHPPRAREAHVENGRSTLNWALKGFGVSGLNPKVLLLFLALLPQFISPHGQLPVAIQILLLGCIHIGSCAVVYTAVGEGARAILATRPGAARIVSRVSGSLMIALGLFLIVERLLL